jgi:predicted porin
MYAVPATAGVRYNNDIQYAGTFGPITVRAEYALGEVPGDNSAGSAKSIGAGYAAGPLAAGASYTKRVIGGLDNDHYTLGGRYSFGPARAYIGYANEKQTTATVDSKTQYTWLGLGYAVSAQVDLIGAWYQNKLTAGVNGAGNAKKDLYTIAATYALSKRTNFYAEIDSTKLKDAYKVGTQTNQTGVSIGINHLF